jgi:hypothetical protein
MKPWMFLTTNKEKIKAMLAVENVEMTLKTPRWLAAALVITRPKKLAAFKIESYMTVLVILIARGKGRRRRTR